MLSLYALSSSFTEARPADIIAGMKDGQAARVADYSGRIFFRAPLLAAILVFLSCLSKEGALEDAPIITSATYQHTQYNGRNQAVEISAARDDTPPFITTYFRSEGDFEGNRNGSAEPPLEVGDYYVRIERPAGNGYRRGADIKIEYHIQKAFISIVADPFQRFACDGRPKEIAARTEPPEEPPLLVSYFAIGEPAAGDPTLGEPAAEALAAPPSRRGRYRAALVFPGNEQYLGASKEVELWIE
jgi:hypothetical protein